MKIILFFLLLCGVQCWGMNQASEELIKRLNNEQEQFLEPEDPRPPMESIGLYPSDYEAMDQHAGEDFLAIAIRLGKIRLNQITKFNEMITPLDREIYFYRLLPEDSRPEDYRDWYAFNGIFYQAAGNYIIEIAKICGRCFPGLTHDYTTIWNENNVHDLNYKRYVYNGFSNVNLNLYQSFEFVTNERILECLQELTNNIMLPLDQNETNLTRDTLILFLSDYLTATNLTLGNNAPDWRYTLKDFLQSHDEDEIVQYIIALSYLIGIYSKGFKGCLPNPLETFNHFKLKLNNFEMIYKAVFYSRNNYVSTQDKRNFDRFCNQGLLMLKDLKEKQGMAIIEQHLNELERTLKRIQAPSYFWWKVLLGSSFGIFGSMLFARKYPDFAEKIPVFRSIFGQQNIFRQFLGKK